MKKMSTTTKRVGAIYSIDEQSKNIQFLGYGQFLGCEIPDEDAMGVAETVRSSGSTNPKILLDSGEVVWGAECWWSNESEIKAEIEEYKKAGYKIIETDITEERKKQIKRNLVYINGVLKDGLKCTFKDDGCKNEFDFYVTFMMGLNAFPVCKEHIEETMEFCERLSFQSCKTKEEYLQELIQEKERLEEMLNKTK